MIRRILLGTSLLLATSPAFAGCIGGSVGDGCIGIPTPSERPYDRDSDRDHRSVVIEHDRAPVVVEHDRAPVVVERHHRAPVVTTIDVLTRAPANIEQALGIFHQSRPRKQISLYPRASLMAVDAPRKV
jgi:hypothetical protein